MEVYLGLLLFVPAAGGASLAFVRLSRTRYIAVTSLVVLPIAATIAATLFAFASSFDAVGWSINVLALISPIFLWWFLLTVGGYMLARRLMR